MCLDDFPEFVAALMSVKLHDEADTVLVHASMGMSEEAGEVLGLVKKSLWYGKEFNKVKAVEEAGDLLHYLQMFCNGLGITIGDLVTTNMSKLNMRYPFGYSDKAAIHRDKKVEAQIFIDFVERLGI